MAAGGATGRTRPWERPEVVAAARDAVLSLVGLVVLADAVLADVPALFAVGAGAFMAPTVIRAERD